MKRKNMVRFNMYLEAETIKQLDTMIKTEDFEHRAEILRTAFQFYLTYRNEVFDV